MMQASDHSLQNIGVLVTRPRHQAHNLCVAIPRCGGHVILFPTIEIISTVDQKKLNEIKKTLPAIDFAIFVSANAVRNAEKCFKQFSTATKIAAIGLGTKAALEKCDMHVDIYPEREFNSEGLLAHAALNNIDGKYVMLFRGEKGRTVLANTLKTRGAKLIETIVYRRVKPMIDASLSLLAWQQGMVNIIVSTSLEGLHNLFDLLGSEGKSWLQETPLLVISPPMLESAKALGYKMEPIIADNASDKAILAALREWKKNQFIDF